MTISAICACGAKLEAKEELAGKRVKCPKCASTLTVPNGSAAVTSIRAACQCGQAFQAKATLAGRSVKCPSCGQALVVPQSSNPGAPSRDLSRTRDVKAVPLVSVHSSDDPLGLGNNFGATLSRRQPPNYAFKPKASHVRYRVMDDEPRGQSRKRYRKQGSKQAELNQDVLVMVTGILCIIFGLGRIGSMYGIIFLLTSGLFFSVGGLVGVAMVLASAGILVAGVGLLTKQGWAMQVGLIAGGGYFAVLAISVIFSLISLAQLASLGASVGVGFDSASLAGRAFVRMIIFWMAQSIVPALLIFVTQRDT